MKNFFNIHHFEFAVRAVKCPFKASVYFLKMSMRQPNICVHKYEACFVLNS